MSRQYFAARARAERDAAIDLQQDENLMRELIRASVETGRKMERERIIELLEKHQASECGFGVSHDLIALIKGENE